MISAPPPPASLKCQLCENEIEASGTVWFECLECTSQTLYPYTFCSSEACLLRILSQHDHPSFVMTDKRTNQEMPQKCVEKSQIRAMVKKADVGFAASGSAPTRDGTYYCSFATSCFSRVEQNWYQCVTCEMEGYTICEVCMRNCHSNHETKPSSDKRGFCYCGAEVLTDSPSHTTTKRCHSLPHDFEHKEREYRSQIIRAGPNLILEHVRVASRITSIACTSDGANGAHFAITDSGDLLYGCEGFQVLGAYKSTVGLVVDQVVCNGVTVFVLLDNGELYECPRTAKSRTQLLQIHDHLRFTQLACMSYFACALTDDNRIIKLSDLSETSHVVTRAPDNFEDVTFRQIACGENFLMLRSENNELYAMGENILGVLGIGDEKQAGQKLACDVPCRLFHIKALTNVISVACGQYHSVALTEKSRGRTAVWTWGSNFYGQLGHDNGFAGCNAPCRVRMFKLLNVRVVNIACGPTCTYCITDSGMVYMFGLGLSGGLDERPPVTPAKAADDQPEFDGPRAVHGDGESARADIIRQAMRSAAADDVATGPADFMSVRDAFRKAPLQSVVKASVDRMFNSEFRGHPAPVLLMSLAEEKIKSIAAGTYKTLFLTERDPGVEEFTQDISGLLSTHEYSDLVPWPACETHIKVQY
eukprot:gnl/Spiro4/961_TR508_c0_g1_i1.p1 gnl/Spiro4/961_TR508_c0_g1~~gnl/Spiro4/961_TR508_c0_g1_i1.p1  ORF type:complete len:646 (-),score=171.45 gnl/Spiro4/961_TR508_c0_g1_i1:48-1985(-)